MKIAIFIIMLFALLVSLSTIVTTIYQLKVRKGYERLKLLKEYKKGRFVLIYLASLLIYFANSLFESGFSPFNNLVTALKNTVNTVVFKVDYSETQNLIESNIFYKIVYFIFLTFLIVNAILFLFSLFYPRILQWYKKKRFIFSKEKIIFFGFNKDNKIMIKSAKKNKIESMVFSNLSERDLEFIIGNKIYYKNSNEEHLDSIEYILRPHLLINKNAKINLIVNTLDDDKNLIITRRIYNLITKYNDDLDIQAYVFGNGESQTAFIDYVEKSEGRINYSNKYQRIAIDFIERYPMTTFMNKEHINYEEALIKNDVNLNVYLLGYGKVNQEILSVSIANNQFATNNGSSVEKKNVNYYIYDNKDISSNKNINHYYKRFETELDQYYKNNDEYLPLDIKPADIINPGKIDFNSPEFYVNLHNSLLNSKDKDINYLIVSFGTDAENIDMAEKLVLKIHEWDVEGTTKIFARVTNSNCVESNSNIRELKLFEESDEVEEIKINNDVLKVNKIKKVEAKEDMYYTFGEEDEVLFNINKLFKDKPMIIAKNRHAIYEAEKIDISNIDENFVNEAYSSWYRKTQIQRDSNYYAYLNIRTKLQLLGYDYIEKDKYNEDKHMKVDFSEFEKKYFQDSSVNKVASKEFDFEGTKYNINKYSFQLEPKDCIRTNIAIQEHLRWNAYTISMGVIPSSINEIISSMDDGKDYKIKRKHNCLTTFEGLKRLRYILAIKNYLKDNIIDENNNIDSNTALKVSCDLLSKDFEKYQKLFDNLEDQKLKEKYLVASDYINYDFEIMDSLEWLLDISGYYLIKK